MYICICIYIYICICIYIYIDKYAQRLGHKWAKGRAKAGSTTLLAFLLLRPPTLLFEAEKFRARTAPSPSNFVAASLNLRRRSLTALRLFSQSQIRMDLLLRGWWELGLISQAAVGLCLGLLLQADAMCTPKATP